MLDLSFSIIVVLDERRGIGKCGQIPWKLPEEMAYFKRITSLGSFLDPNVVVMGRRTWESIDPKYRPLSDRINIVVSSSPEFVDSEKVLWASSFNQALLLASLFKGLTSTTWVIGGAQIYDLAVKHKGFRELYLSRIEGTYDCDKFFPVIDGLDGWQEVAYKHYPYWDAYVFRRIDNVR